MSSWNEGFEQQLDSISESSQQFSEMAEAITGCIARIESSISNTRGIVEIIRWYDDDDAGLIDDHDRIGLKLVKVSKEWMIATTVGKKDGKVTKPLRDWEWLQRASLEKKKSALLVLPRFLVSIKKSIEQQTESLSERLEMVQAQFELLKKGGQ